MVFTWPQIRITLKLNHEVVRAMPGSNPLQRFMLTKVLYRSKKMSGRNQLISHDDHSYRSNALRIINRVSLFLLLLLCTAHFPASAPATAPQELAGQYSIGTRFSGSTIMIDSTNGYHIDSS